VQSPIVIDASALVELLIRSKLGDRVERALGEADVLAPDIVNAEVMQSLRGLERGGKLTGPRASTAISRLTASPISRIPTTALLPSAWALRANLSAYDACYVALARFLDCALLTTDRPLTRAPDLQIPLIIV
jgi:predicted nucleic acid-binding protein